MSDHKFSLTGMVQLGLVILAVVGGASCDTVGQPVAIPTVSEPRWLLIKNPRFGDFLSEPEYIWVAEDKVPATITTLIRGKSAIIAPPGIVAKYGPPPPGGKVSPRQGATCRPSWVRKCESSGHVVIPIVHPVTGEVLGSLPCDCGAD